MSAYRQFCVLTAEDRSAIWTPLHLKFLFSNETNGKTTFFYEPVQLSYFIAHLNE